MKLFYVSACIALMLASCNNEAGESTQARDTTVAAVAADLPYTATYSSNFSTDVSDADLKMVLDSYKDWADGDIAGLESSLADSVSYDANSGMSRRLSKADLGRMWAKSRDSLSSVSIEMYAWQKMYAVDKKEANVVTWYKEIDTYKDGRVDSATYHDINGIKNGKIEWYSSMKRGFIK